MPQFNGPVVKTPLKRLSACFFRAVKCHDGSKRRHEGLLNGGLMRTLLQGREDGLGTYEEP